jgi:hypothetical protein
LKHSLQPLAPKKSKLYLSFLMGVLVFALTGNLVASQENSEKARLQTMNRLCGNLVRAKDIPAKGRQNVVGHKTNALKGFAIQLMEWREGRDCCTGLKIVAEERSRHGGRFEFRNIEPGRYWVVATVDGHEYKMPVRYVRKADDLTSCSNLFYEAYDSGEFGLAITVTVD